MESCRAASPIFTPALICSVWGAFCTKQISAQWSEVLDISYPPLAWFINSPCSYSPCPLPPPQSTLRSVWTELPDTRLSAQSHTPSGSSRPGQDRGYPPQHWPDAPGSAHDLKDRRNDTCNEHRRKNVSVKVNPDVILHWRGHIELMLPNFMGSVPCMSTLLSQWCPELLPAVSTCPMITSETSSGLTSARFRTSLITTEHRSCTGTEDRVPFKDPV